jgi:rhomboid protease GluP
LNDISHTENSYADALPVANEGTGIAAVEASIDGTAEAAAHEKADRNTRLWNYPATYTLMGINIAVYAVMFGFGPIPAMLHSHMWTGVLTASFDVDTLTRFGATASEQVQQGQWWRLVTGAFVHVTLLHILLNMWCLWNLGLFGEPLLGKRGLVVVYLLTGTAGMLLSYTFSIVMGQPGLVAGASGAVFGIAGILIVLLSNRKLSVPWEELKKLRGQVILFAAVNLVLGLVPNVLAMGSVASLHFDPTNLPRIDNSAHLGGFLSGLALGLPLFPKMTSGKSSYRHRQGITYVIATLLLCLYGYALAKFALKVA